MNNNIGDNVRKLRILFDIKQQTMAQLIGISVNSYGKIERNEVSISKERLIQIANILGVEVSQIVDFNELIATLKSPPPKRAVRRLNRLKQL